MDLPLWGLLVVIFFPLVQVPAVLYLSQYFEIEAGDLPTPPMRAYWRGVDHPESPGSTDDSEQGVVRCDRCGAPNAPGFDRCQRCVAPIGDP